MNLDRHAEPGRALVVRARRRLAHSALGYTLPVSLAVAAVCGAVIVALGVAGGQAVLAVLGGIALFVLVAVTLIVPAFAMAGSRYVKGRDDGAGLPLAELGPDGVRVRYRIASPRERRRGVPDPPAFDAAVPWDAVVGWRHGRDPHGQAVIVLDLNDPEKVTQRGGTQRLAGDWRLDRYVDSLREATGSPIAIRAPIAGADQVDAVLRQLGHRGLTR